MNKGAKLALDSGAIAWVLAATALVMLMTPALLQANSPAVSHDQTIAGTNYRHGRDA